MKILLTGSNGQVGFELAKKLNILGELISTNREKLDLVDTQAISDFIDETKPNIIVNCAAYTAVDKAESEVDLAYLINTIAPEVLVEKSAKLNIPIIHFSTNYIFDGLKKEAYIETDTVNPQSIYAKTKYEGELKVCKYPKHIILRSSWIFGSHGNNFLKNILRLIQDKESLKIIADQWGRPTSASMLADVTFKIVDAILKNQNFKDYGIYHVASENETTWHQYAHFIANEAMQLNLKIKCKSDHIYPISTLEYPATAKRPLNSNLNIDKLKKTFKLKLPHWESEVKKVMKEIIKVSNLKNYT